MKPAAYRYSKCRVDRCVDGDTVDLWINLGFSTFVKKRVRLMGINTPESRTRDLEEKKRGKAATAYMESLLEGGYCDLDSHELGKYGRVLGTLWVDGKDLNQEMIDAGHAVAYFGGKRG
jgi:micrococcal nuclease